ncbi:hypothetical protein [Streptomyces lancefieldiae]|uniref:Gliding motility protein n=1 Tax=Streptomyces lancefieldiae TaxID=3075520 RepID=A0ABU3AQY6_9ACTN|nr:hypothetical protein [Streptomyces sp. DSM 40712]MDT0612359.1 hypothetical protein [Streptomyces sp. DSM 40712]
MGVFARLLRRSRTTEEAPAAETQADTPKPERAAAENATEAAGTADAGPRNTVRPAEPDEADVTADPEDVGIPKQQSAGEAVDNDSDKGART